METKGQVRSVLALELLSDSLILEVDVKLVGSTDLRDNLDSSDQRLVS